MSRLRNPLSRHRDPVAPRPQRASHAASQRVPRAPWWVRWFTNGGRPIVAVVVLVMCAPGEHHLARLAGWDGRLAWGMAAVLAAYAGIAASVASNRPAGSPGKGSAVVGAFVSLGAAMAAQPVSHLFVTGWLSATPRAPWQLVVFVSCVPPLVFGHLLHLAATPTGVSVVPAAVPAPMPAEQPGAIPEPVPVPEQRAVFEQFEPEPEPPLEQPETASGTGRFLTPREVADRYGVSVSTVRTWKDRGKIAPAFTDPRLGNMYDPETLPKAVAAG